MTLIPINPKVTKRCFTPLIYITIVIVCWVSFLKFLTQPEVRHVRKLTLFYPRTSNSMGNEVDTEHDKNNATIFNSPNSPCLLSNYNGIIDCQSPSTRPWTSDETCNEYEIHFAKPNTFPLRALVSFPGSGNSWIRYMIECSSGFFTGSIYTAHTVYKQGLLGERRDFKDGTTIVQKTHDVSITGKVDYSSNPFDYRGILVIRNPYDALKSYWSFLITRDHQTTPTFIQTSTEQLNWYKFVKEKAKNWASLITTWVGRSSQLLIVQYEELKKNPRQELVRILNYLGQPSDPKRLDCLLSETHAEGPFHRPKPAVQQGNLSEIYEFLPLAGQFGGKGKFYDITVHSNSTHKVNSDLMKLLNQFAQVQDIYISKNTTRAHFSLLSLDFIVQGNIQAVNTFFKEKRVSLFLNYQGPSK